MKRINVKGQLWRVQQNKFKWLERERSLEDEIGDFFLVANRNSNQSEIGEFDLNYIEMLKMEEKCIEEHAPLCKASCPMHLDVRGMMAEVQNGDFDSAYRLFRKAVLFPNSVSKICDAPCQQKCKRIDLDSTVLIREIEQAVARYGKSAEKDMKPVIHLDKKVAIIGGGVSGAAVAAHLFEKGFDITIFEKSNRIGGQVWEYSNLSKEEIESDFNFLEKCNINIEYEKEVGKDICFSDLYRDFDAIYMSGIQDTKVHELELDENQCIKVNPVTFQTPNEKVFVGGHILHEDRKYSIITSISEGKSAAISIDRYLKNVSVTANRLNEGIYETKLYTSVQGLVEKPQIVPVEEDGFNKEEAIKEAERCMLCRCMECVKQCKYLEKFEKFPRQYIREISNNLTIVLGFKTAKPLINSCSLCGLCTEICPNGIEMNQVAKAARQKMVASENMPIGIHDFPIRDMLFSNSSSHALCKHEPGKSESKYLFFPGCQLAASSPQYIQPMYEYLVEHLDGGVGMMLGCCGAPADWAGRSDIHSETIELLEKNWSKMGKPKVITACTTCHQAFKEVFKDMKLQSIWEIYSQFGLPEVKRHKGKKISIHDPCTSRHETSIHHSVRDVLKTAGYEIDELEYSKNMTKCCGYGGLVFYGNRELADSIIESRVSERPNDYVAYCAVCRDYFALKDKPTFHLLDIIYGKNSDEEANRKGNHISKKRENRIQLKQQLIKNIFKDEGDAYVEQYEEIDLVIDEEVRGIMEKRLILDEDIMRVIEKAERTGCKTYHPKNRRFIASDKPHLMTYWVEYSKQGDAFKVHNAYSHILEIQNY